MPAGSAAAPLRRADAERVQTGGQLVEQHTERVEVGAAVGRLARLFGRHVAGRTHDRAGRVSGVMPVLASATRAIPKSSTLTTSRPAR